jgi:high-affinity nickel permease
MDWNRLAVIASQCIVVIVLGVLVGLGHDSTINDALLAVSGSLAGVGIYHAVTTKTPPADPPAT